MAVYKIVVRVELSDTWPLAEKRQMYTVFQYNALFSAVYSDEVTSQAEHHKTTALLAAGGQGHVQRVIDIELSKLED